MSLRLPTSRRQCNGFGNVAAGAGARYGNVVGVSGDGVHQTVSGNLHPVRIDAVHRHGQVTSCGCRGPAPVFNRRLDRDNIFAEPGCGGVMATRVTLRSGRPTNLAFSLDDWLGERF